jgi:hypothetical protein
MSRFLGASVLIGVAVAAGLGGAQAPDKDSGPKPREDAKLGLVLIYPDRVDAEAYFQAHPCVSGGWRLESESESHWIGVLNYPTGNVPPAYPTGSEAAFQVRRIKVAKRPGLAIDMKKWTGTVVLLQADAKERFGTPKSLDSSFELVGYGLPSAKGRTGAFLFQKRPELLYKGKEK